MVIMNNSTVLNVKIDKELKKQAQEVAKALGLPVSTLVSASLKDIVRRRSITISEDRNISPEVEREILKISANAKAGKDVSPEFSDIDEAIAWLSSEVKKESK